MTQSCATGLKRPMTTENCEQAGGNHTNQEPRKGDQAVGKKRKGPQ